MDVLGLVALAVFATTALAQAQNLFAPVAKVNDSTITVFELDQKMQLITTLNNRQASRDEALEQLIEERVQTLTARAQGISATGEELLEGMSEFAARGERSREEFVALLAQAGVAEETFRDFVGSGLLWRKLVQGRFIGTQNISEADVDRAIALEANRAAAASRVQVLLSEIFLIARDAEEAARAEALAARIAEIRSFDEFSAAARQVSAAPTRDQGGRLDWLALNSLPPPLRSQILSMQPGEISAPLRVPTAIGLFQLRGVSDGALAAPVGGFVDYVEVTVAAATAQEALQEAQSLSSRADACDDYYGLTKDDASLVLNRASGAVDGLPVEVALRLARLDPQEQVVTQAGAGARITMLCSRRAAQSEPDRDTVRLRLVNERLTAQADAYLAELKALANIEIIR